MGEGVGNRVGVMDGDTVGGDRVGGEKIRVGKKLKDGKNVGVDDGSREGAILGDCDGVEVGS